MKTKISVVALLIFSFSTIANAMTHNQDEGASVLVVDQAPAVEPGVIVQDGFMPTPLQPAMPPMYQYDVFQDDVLMTAPHTVLSPAFAPPAGCCCSPCNCCKVETTICLVDPCGCTHEACVCVPQCCVGQTPCVSWRKGVLGRQIADICWECCDHDVKVIVTRKGKVRVRG